MIGERLQAKDTDAGTSVLASLWDGGLVARGVSLARSAPGWAAAEPQTLMEMAGRLGAGVARELHGRPRLRPILISNPRSGTHYLKQLITWSLGRPALERNYATAQDLNATLAATRNGQLVYGHFNFNEFGEALHPARRPKLRLVLLTRHPIDRLISQLALTRAQGGPLPDPTCSPQQLARELLLGEWDGRRWSNGTVVADYAAIHNFYLRQLHTEWLALPHVMAVHFEDLVGDPAATLARVLGFIGLKAPSRRIRKVMSRINFASLANGRVPGDVDPASHYRRGLPGEWRSVFSAADIRAMRPRYAEAFAAAGYEL